MRARPSSLRDIRENSMHVSGSADEEDDEEEVEIKISPTGSVLAPSPNPYDKLQKLRQANAQLMASRLPPRPPGKVRFNDSVITSDEINNEGTQIITTVEPLKSAPCKILLVTVPTGFSEDIDDTNSDDDVIDETDFRECDDTVEKAADVRDSSSNIKKAIAYQEYSVDMKSIDDDYENRVEDLTTTLVSLCRMTSECDDTDLANNISKFDKNTIQPTIDEVECRGSQEFESGDSVESVNSQLGNPGHQETTPEADSRNSPEREEYIEPIKHQSVKKVAELKRISSAQPTSKKIQEKTDEQARPSTSPGKRVCFKNQWATVKLPQYNGLRSEYGLSSEQLQERKKKRLESAASKKQEKQERYKEARRKQKENEIMFANWLVKKKKEAAMKAARRKQLHSAFYFKTLPAPTGHLEKMGLLRKKVLARREHTCYSLEEFFKNAKPHEQKTYRIYLGLCVE
ncbi:Hypothetical protein NTJ_00470 [Nesidiocoris tenuis]|nr:Hypothetical protein NTJ_00470 [Nesidiocoris tenuis]